MRNLFYNLVENITEYKTGLTNGELTLWNFIDYIEVSDNVALALNLICACLVVIAGFAIYDITKIIKNRRKSLA